MKTLAVQLVTYNGEKYLPFLLDSVFAQQGIEFDLFVWDNASTDNTKNILARYSERYATRMYCTYAEKNSGFSGGHNALYAQICKKDYRFLALLNQDMLLEPYCFARMIETLEKIPSAAACTPRIMRWNATEAFAGNIAGSKTHTIDTLGLRVLRNRRVVEVGGGAEWNENTVYDGIQKKDGVQKVFGVSGALPFFSLSALKAVELPGGELFDRSFFMYKEDVDLAWRLRRKGYEAVCVTDAVAYHDRTASGPADLRDISASIQKKSQGAVVRRCSYVNHLRVLIFHTSCMGFLLDFFPILWYEGKKALWFLLYDRGTLFCAIKMLVMNFCGLMEGRRLRNDNITDNTLRVWWQ